MPATEILVDGFDHPEGVAWDPATGTLWAGGEDGQLYRVDIEARTRAGAARAPGFVLGLAAAFGVDASFVGTDDTLRTPLAFCEIHPPDHFPLLFYREPTAPDLQLTDDDLRAAPVEDVALLWVTGTGLSQEPSRSATLA